VSTQPQKLEFKEIKIIHFKEKRNRSPEEISSWPKFIHLVAEPTLLNKSPDSKFKNFRLYPFIQITKQKYAK
jgi:hypothetical protein